MSHRILVIAFALLAVCPLASRAQDTPAPDPLVRFGWLADLAGSCWTGTDTAGRTTDRQCYTIQFGHFVRGTIDVAASGTTGTGGFRGDSVFAWDAGSGRIVYHFWASTGHIGSAECFFDGPQLIFPLPDDGKEDTPRLRSRWERVDSDSFRVVRESGDGQVWQESMRVVYRRDAAPASPAAGPLAPLAWLAGSCWTGTFANGTTRDLGCYDWMLGGKFLRSRHRIEGGTAPYSGETILGHNSVTGKLEFSYYNSAGGIVRGEIEPTTDGLRFPAEKIAMEGRELEVRSVWTRQGNDRYVAASEKLVDGAWQPFMRIEFVRSGPASDWGEED